MFCFLGNDQIDRIGCGNINLVFANNNEVLLKFYFRMSNGSRGKRKPDMAGSHTIHAKQIDNLPPTFPNCIYFAFGIFQKAIRKKWRSSLAHCIVLKIQCNVLL